MFHVTKSSTRRALHLAHCWLLPDASEKRPLSDSLFDHLVGTAEQWQRHCDAERLGGLEVDHHLVLGGSLHGQISRLVAIQNAIDVGCGAPELVEKIWPVRTQP